MAEINKIKKKESPKTEEKPKEKTPPPVFVKEKSTKHFFA